jgi:hypothetical protein
MGLVGTGEIMDSNVVGITTASSVSMAEGKNINLYALVVNNNFNANRVNVLNDLILLGLFIHRI